MSAPSAALFEIDGRCKCGRCAPPDKGTYWMDGSCRNCRTEARLVIEFWRGQEKRPVTCPACGCRNTVEPNRFDPDYTSISAGESPGDYCGTGLCAYLEGHEGPCGT